VELKISPLECMSHEIGDYHDVRVIVLAHAELSRSFTIRKGGDIFALILYCGSNRERGVLHWESEWNCCDSIPENRRIDFKGAARCPFQLVRILTS
jgi:hypothetical protein